MAKKSIFFELPQGMTRGEVDHLMTELDKRFPHLLPSHARLASTVYDKSNGDAPQHPEDAHAMRVCTNSTEDPWGFANAAWYRSPGGQGQYHAVEVPLNDLFSYNDV